VIIARPEIHAPRAAAGGNLRGDAGRVDEVQPVHSVEVPTVPVDELARELRLADTAQAAARRHGHLAYGGGAAGLEVGGDPF